MRLSRYSCVYLLIALLAGCGGGGSTPATLAQSSGGGEVSLTYAFSGGPASYVVPPVAGYAGTLLFPASASPVRTTLTLGSSLLPPDEVSLESLKRAATAEQSTGTLSFYYYVTIQFPVAVSFATVPEFTVTLPKSIEPAGQQFFYAISQLKPSNGAEKSFRTQGPASVSGQRLTFASSTTPLTFNGGKRYSLALYSTTTPVASTTTIASVRLSFGHAKFLGNSASGAPTSAIPLEVVALDAAGKTLEGSTPFTNPLALTTSDPMNGKLSRTRLASPDDETGITIAYSGETKHKILFSASAAGVSPASVSSVELAPRNGFVKESPDDTFGRTLPLSVTLSDSIPGYSLGYYILGNGSCSSAEDFATCTTTPTALSCNLNDESVESSPPGEENIVGTLTSDSIHLKITVDSLEVAQGDECLYSIGDFYGNTNANDQLRVSVGP